MKRLLPAAIFCLLAFPVLQAQNQFAGVDLLYPELAHPAEDARAAIKKGDLRFLTIDRYGKDTPGMERYGRLQETYGTKFLRQPFRIVASSSQIFSFNLRVRVYAREYNQTLLHHLLRQGQRK